LQITPIRLPKELILCTGFVGYGSSTKQLIPKILRIKKNKTYEYNKTIFSINNVVENLIAELQAHASKENQKQILALIKKNKDLLKQFYPQLETYELTKLITIANKFESAAKFSGAGGGDCGIAICFDPNIAKKIKNEWKKEGIYPLDIEVLQTK
jgi:phosphomevalonate kinase